MSVRDGIASVKLSGGEKVEAVEVNSGGKGSKTMLSIRPERCVLAKTQTREHAMLKARVEELIYLGDHIRCRVNVVGVDNFIVKCQTLLKQRDMKLVKTYILAGQGKIAGPLIICKN
jgi:putative spermidine/putrescine transport system ATP-binding protein